MGNIKHTFKSTIIIGIVIFIIERTISNNWDLPIKDLIPVFIIFQLYSFVIAYANGYFFASLDSRYSWTEKPKKRLLIGTIGSFVITMICIVLLRYIVVIVFYQESFQDFLNTSNYYYIFSLIITANVIIIFHAIYFFKALTEKKVTKHKVISKTQSAKFESLKNQLDPHFLFNSLNVLTSLIEENPKQAERFTTKLSKIYRYVLTQKNEDLVLATEELKFAKTYTDLLQMRFEDAVVFNIPENLDVENLKIIPLALQLLLENAVKHNVITSNKKLEIRIYQENNYLVVENNINKKSTIEKSTKVGLQNIVDRYSLVTLSKVIIEDNNKTFKVKLPLLIQKTKIMNTSYNKEEKYYKAKKQVKKIKDFYTALFMYCLFIPFIIFIWYNYSRGTMQWFWFPILGWGLGLFFQGADAFNKFPVFGNDWEKRKIQEFMEDDEQVRF